jgi:hypothetical protein
MATILEAMANVATYCWQYAENVVLAASGATDIVCYRNNLVHVDFLEGMAKKLICYWNSTKKLEKAVV